MSEKTYSIKQVRDYVEGWLSSTSDTEKLDINQIKAMLHNSLNMLEDCQDGINPWVTYMNMPDMAQSIKIPL